MKNYSPEIEQMINHIRKMLDEILNKQINTPRSKCSIFFKNKFTCHKHAKCAIRNTNLFANVKLVRMRSMNAKLT